MSLPLSICDGMPCNLFLSSLHFVPRTSQSTIHSPYHAASQADHLHTFIAALKMAVGANAPGHYVHKVITKLVDRLHASKDWLVRLAIGLFLSQMCYRISLSSHHPVTRIPVTSVDTLASLGA